MCNEISKLRQVWKDEKGRTLTDNPEYLYQKYLNHSVSIPDNATIWPLHLPPAYLSALEDKLRRRVTSADDFRIPDLSVIDTKPKQFQALREVCNVSVKCFTQMEEGIEYWRELLQLHQPRHIKEKGVSLVID